MAGGMVLRKAGTSIKLPQVLSLLAVTEGQGFVKCGALGAGFGGFSLPAMTRAVCALLLGLMS